MERIYYVKPREKKDAATLVQLLTGVDPNENYIPGATTVRRKPQYYREGNDWYNVTRFIDALVSFNTSTEELRSVPRNSLYKHYTIPKRNGKRRPIDEPCETLMNALRLLKSLFDQYFGVYFHHPCAFAYIKERGTIDCAKVHQKADNHWFAHYDFSNFFGSTTLEFTMKMCKMIYPLNRVMETQRGKDELEKALELCFLNGGLPQGTPISPFLTNIIMIPFDHEFMNWCGNEAKPHFTYTRYADDIEVSCKFDFDPRMVEHRINETLGNLGAPFRINEEKTEYGNRAGRNWILGVMLNKDNNITVGYRNKKFFKSALTSYCLSVKNHTLWDIEEVYELQGKLSHYRQVEREYFNHVVNEYNNKFGINIEKCMKAQIKGELVA